jgi:hypothetical protein
MRRPRGVIPLDGRKRGRPKRERSRAYPSTSASLPLDRVRALRRRGRYNVARLMEQYGAAKLPELLYALANCRRPKPRASTPHARGSTAKTTEPICSNSRPASLVVGCLCGTLSAGLKLVFHVQRDRSANARRVPPQAASHKVPRSRAVLGPAVPHQFPDSSSLLLVFSDNPRNITGWRSGPESWYSLRSSDFTSSLSHVSIWTLSCFRVGSRATAGITA